MIDHKELIDSFLNMVELNFQGFWQNYQCKFNEHIPSAASVKHTKKIMDSILCLFELDVTE